MKKFGFYNLIGKVAVLLLPFLLFSACGKAVPDTSPSPSLNVQVPTQAAVNDSSPVQLEFGEKFSIDMLRKINGSEVIIYGYISMSSPADGSFMYITSLPCQSTPFTFDNSKALSDTIEVYPAQGKVLKYTTLPVSIKGRLVLSDVDEGFTDVYGYSYNYCIADAECEPMKPESLSGTALEYYRLAEAGVIEDLLDMFDYVSLMTHWSEYMCSPQTDSEGNVTPGYWFYPGDVYEYKKNVMTYVTDTYFEDLISKTEKVKDVSEETMTKLSSMIADCAELCSYAQQQIEDEAWTTETKYWDAIGCEETKYTLNEQEKLSDDSQSLWLTLCEFLSESGL